ncbi:hypothetical protein QTO34_009951 [Cnephaeus nilssonii]|uniref:Uncharacterized protein n=1 Tax=Cnephaeus nilssonii TaxID=3371016 RepID=A0AA40HEQ1_CNENI|nr:hypothetical protein QTO34_009951 [Eptesicus nilssonii]
MHSSWHICIVGTTMSLDDEVTGDGGKINALSKAAGVYAEPFWPGLFAKARPCQHWESRLQCRGWWTCPCSECCTSRRSCPSITAAPAEEKTVEAKKEEWRGDPKAGAGHGGHGGIGYQGDKTEPHITLLGPGGWLVSQRRLNYTNCGIRASLPGAGPS